MSVSKINDEYFYVGGQLLLMGAMFIFNVVAAKFVGPGQMGIWQTINLVSTYGMIVTLGIINGMGRDVPFHRGRSDYRQVRTIIATTLSCLLPLIAVFVVAISLLKLFNLKDTIN